MGPFKSRATRERDTDDELVKYAAWLIEVREPDVNNDGIRRLESEIHAMRNDLLANLGQRFVRPRTSKNITNIRKDLDVLKGMVFAWLYVSGKYTEIPALMEVTEDVNDLAMIWLSVDLTKMYAHAHPPKAEPAEKPAKALGGYDRHEYKPDFTRTGDPCDVCGFSRNNAVHN